MNEISLAEMAARVYSKVELDAEGCLIWPFATNKGGYGLIKVNGGNKITHRLTYRAKYGEVPEGLELDHTCEKRRCANPDCLEPVTHAENLRRSRERGRFKPARKEGDLCAEGHLLVGDNIWKARKRGRTYLLCATCTKAKRAGRIAA